MLIEFVRPVDQMDAGRTLRFDAGERREFPDVVAHSLVVSGDAVAVEVAPKRGRAAKP